MGIITKLRKTLPVYRVGTMIENQLSEIQKQNMKIQDEMLILKNQNLTLLQGIDAKVGDLKNDLSLRFWLTQRQNGETIDQTKARVLLNYPKAEGNRRRFQLADAELLRRTKEVCDQHGIELYLLWGTLLGSVRHQGFIPWDDDIDIGILSEEYTRLSGILADDPDLQMDWYYNWEYGIICPKIKFRDCDSFWLDLMILEHIDINPETAEKRRNELIKIAEAYQKECLRVIRKYYPVEKPCLIPVRDKRIDQETEAVRTKYRKKVPYYGNGTGIISSMDISFQFMGMDCFLPEEFYPIRKDEMLFEGERYSTIHDVEGYLTKNYGDYMDFPMDMFHGRHTHETDQFIEKDLETFTQKYERKK